MLGIQIEKRFLKRRELEKIILFGTGLGGTAAVWAGIAGSSVNNISIVENAVLSGVMPSIDKTVLAAKSKKPLHGVGMLQIGGADEFIALNAEFIPGGAPFGGHFCNEFRFRDSGLARGAFDIHTMLVGACGHHHVVTHHALVATNRVAHDSRVGVADMRQAIGIVNRRGQIIFWPARRHALTCLSALFLEFEQGLAEHALQRNILFAGNALAILIFG